MRIVKLFLPVTGLLSEVVPLQPGPVCGGYKRSIPAATCTALLCSGDAPSLGDIPPRGSAP